MKIEGKMKANDISTNWFQGGQSGPIDANWGPPGPIYAN